MATMIRASELRCGDHVRNDPGYGTAAVVVNRSMSRDVRVYVQFRNVYEGDTYTAELDRNAMFEVQNDATILDRYAYFYRLQEFERCEAIYLAHPELQDAIDALLEDLA